MNPELYRRAGSLFDELADQPQEEAAARLEDLARQEPELVALTRRLLDADRAPPRLLLDAPAATGIDEKDPARVLGSSIGPYRIESLLGRGGMGAVYLGHRDEPPARVAIKFVTLDAAPAEVRERFRLETRWLAALDHPGVVRYRSSGFDLEGRPYLVMDVIDGAPLGAGDSAEASLRTRVGWLIEVADAVHHMHQRGVLHGDLKPSNILLAQRDEGRAPVVIDLGIARALGNAEEGPGLPAGGTPRYMSPELQEGSAGPDVRSDVYALGRVGARLLLGEGGARPGRIDAQLRAVLDRASATRPEHRHGSAEALADDLRRWRQRRPVRAVRAGWRTRLGLLARRRPLELSSVLLSVTVLAVAATLLVQSFLRERAARERLEEQTLVNQETIDFFAQELFRRAMPGNDGPNAPVVDVLRGASSSFARNDSARGAPVMVGVGSSLLGIFMSLDLMADADRVAADTEAHALALSPDDPARLRFELIRAMADFEAERHERSLHRLRELWSRLEDLHPDGLVDADAVTRLRAATAKGLGIAHEQRGDFDEAIRWLRRSLQDPADGIAMENLQLESRYALAMVQMRRGQDPEAIASYEVLLETFLQRDGPRSPRVLGVRTNLATLCSRSGRAEEALAHAQAAWRIADAILDAEHENRLIALSVLAVCHNAVEDYDEAAAVGMELVERCRGRYGERSPERASQLLNLVENLILAVREEEAEGLANEALEIYESQTAPDPEDLLRARVYAAEIALVVGRPERAARCVREALATPTDTPNGRSLVDRAQAVLTSLDPD